MGKASFPVFPLPPFVQEERGTGRGEGLLFLRMRKGEETQEKRPYLPAIF